MGNLPAILWLLIIGFWAGFGFREWRYRRAARYGPSIEEQVGAGTIKSARDVAWTRKIIGDGFEITRVATLHLAGKTYKIEVSEDEAADV